MKKIRLAAVVLCLSVLAASLAGCGLFADNKGNAAAEGSAENSVFEIKLSDEVTIKDPEGLDFDVRYVLYADAGNATIQIYASMGVALNEEYVVIYGKGDKVVGEYQYFVFADEASQSTMQSMVPTMENYGLVSVNVQSDDAIDGVIASMIAAQMMTDETPASYADMYKNVYMYADYTVSE